jgi:two-component sensor histidine kinase/ligand-binding sensor domain-containing protein
LNKSGLEFLILLLALVALTATRLLGQAVQFSSLSLKDGLSQNTVTALLQDREGFIWVGTRDGLNRYDGRNFLVFRGDRNATNRLSGNTITALYQDSRGFLWVGTNFGLNKLDPETFEVESFNHWFEDSLSLSSNTVRCIAEDAEGNLWVGTSNGLNRMTSEHEFKRYKIDEEDDKSLPGKEVQSLLVDKTGNLWVATEGGLGLFQPQEDAFLRFRYEYDDKKTISHNNVLALAEGADEHTIWVGTRNGLNRLDTETYEFERFFKNAPRPNFLSSDIIRSLLVDGDNIWVGTPNGLNRINPQTLRSSIYRHGNNELNSLPNDFILSMMVDTSGMIWIGTQSAGIATLNLEVPLFQTVTNSGSRGFEPERNRIYGFDCSADSLLWVATGMGIYLFNPRTEERIFDLPPRNHPINTPDFTALDILAAGDTILWIATERSGLWKYEIESDELTKFTVDSENPDGISSNRVNDILLDEKGCIWIGTSGGGVNRYDLSSGEFKAYRFDGEDPTSIRDNNIISLALDSEGRIWIGTGNAGAYLLDPTTDEFLIHLHEESKEHPLPHNTVNAIYLDPEGVVWVGTGGGGLARFDRAADSLAVYNRSSGLGNDFVYGISSDRFENIWLSTNAGLSAFNTRTNTFRNYTEEAVLSRNVFIQGSCFRSSNGIIYFGGANGFDFFNSFEIKENTYVPKVAIVNVDLLGDEAADTLGGRYQPINDTVVVPAGMAGVTFEFSSLSYKQPEKNQFAYRLPGVVDEWEYIGTRRYVSFSSIKPGNYVFEVLGSNNDGVWSAEPTSVAVIVKPTLSETLAFRILIALAVIGSLFAFYRYQTSREKARRRTLEKTVAERTKEIAKERDTNAMLLREVHHRVKNNLQVIVSLLNLQSIYIKDRAMIGVLSEIQNRIRSMSMIHQKMYKTENLASLNLREYIEDLSKNLIDTYRVQQRVELDVEVTVDDFSSDTLTPLGLFINEVISNSLKHAFKKDREGKITVKLHSRDGNKYRLEIGDNGIGFSNDPDEQTDSFGTELIGALTEQLNGELEVKSGPEGTYYKLDFEDIGRED